MKVLILFQHPGIDDMNYTDYAIELNKKTNIAIFCVMRSDYDGKLKNTAIPCRSIDIKSKFDFHAIKNIRAWVKEEKFDIIQTFTNHALSVALCATIGLKKKPKIVAHRGIIDKVSRTRIDHWLTLLHPRVAHIICVSNAAKKGLLESHLPEKKLSTIYTSFFADAFTTLSTSWHVPSLPKDAFVVGVVANYRHIKGVDLIFEAAKNLNKHIHFVILGDGYDEVRSSLCPGIKNQFHFLGYRNDAKALMKHFDLFVMTSRKEGLCHSLLEAMAQQVCPVISNVGGMAEVVEHKKNGWVIASEDVNALEKAISALYHDKALRKELANNAQKRIIEDFTMENRITQSVDVFRQLCQNEH